VEDIEPDEDGVINVFNHGINQDEDAAINTAKEQTYAFEDGEGTVYAVINPHTGSFLSEVLYAGYDKTNEYMGGILPLTNSSNANIDISHQAESMGAEVNSVNQSRGSLTQTNSVQRQLNDGETDIPLTQVVFNGAVANAQTMANRLSDATNGDGDVLQSRNRSDLIVAWAIGWNPKSGETGGNKLWFPTQWMGDAHGAYGPNVDPSKIDKVWGEEGNRPDLVLPNRSQE